MEVEKLTGNYVAPSLGQITVGELGKEWLARQVQLVWSPGKGRDFHPACRRRGILRQILVPDDDQWDLERSG